MIPFFGGFVHTNLITNFLKSLVDFLIVISDRVPFINHSGLPFLKIIFGVLSLLDCSVLTDGVFDIVVQFGINFSKGSFHDVNGVSDLLDLALVVFDELEDFSFLDPLDLDETFVKDLVELIDLVLDQWSLNWMEARHNSIVLTNDDLELGDLSLELLIGLIDRGCGLWDWSVQEVEVLDLFEHFDQIRIEVDLKEVILISGEDVELKLLLGVGLDIGLPVSDLGVFVLFDVLVEGVVELLSILEFFSFSDGFAEAGKFLIGLLDSFFETFGPGKGTGDGWHVLEDWILFVEFVTEFFTFGKDNLNLLKILLVGLNEDDVLLLELIQNVWTVE
jgi:hypothetical protein